MLFHDALKKGSSTKNDTVANFVGFSPIFKNCQNFFQSFTLLSTSRTYFTFSGESVAEEQVKNTCYVYKSFTFRAYAPSDTSQLPVFVTHGSFSFSTFLGPQPNSATSNSIFLAALQFCWKAFETCIFRDTSCLTSFMTI